MEAHSNKNGSAKFSFEKGAQFFCQSNGLLSLSRGEVLERGAHSLPTKHRRAVFPNNGLLYLSQLEVGLENSHTKFADENRSGHFFRILAILIQVAWKVVAEKKAP